ALLHGHLFKPHFTQPPDQIASPITTRHALVPANRQKNVAASTGKFLCDLRARCTRSDNQYLAGWKLIGPLVRSGMDLEEVNVLCQRGRDERAVIRPGGKDGTVGDEGGLPMSR